MTLTTMKRVPLPSTLEDPVDPEHLRIMNTYFHYEMYLYRRRERLLPRRPVNAYFLYTAPKSNRCKNARFKGITAETTACERMHVV